MTYELYCQRLSRTKKIEHLINLIGYYSGLHLANPVANKLIKSKLYHWNAEFNAL